jgi:hypothetical protein
LTAFSLCQFPRPNKVLNRGTATVIDLGDARLGHAFVQQYLDFLLLPIQLWLTQMIPKTTSRVWLMNVINVYS